MILQQKLEDKTAVIGIIGLGYVGLPLAVSFAKTGYTVLGFDLEPDKVNMINNAQSYIADITNRQLKNVSPNLTATCDENKLNEPDCLIICVPTPLTKTKQPDLSFVRNICEVISQQLRPGQLVVMESTTYPGTTRDIILPLLETSGLKIGHDFYLGYSPERVDPGNTTHTIKEIPKIIAGIDSQSTSLVETLYSQIVDQIVPVSSTEAAELTKLFENVFRLVNIALVNELTLLCQKMGLNVWEIIDAAATKPYGYMKFKPGPGVGGHCIPLDPYYLANKAREYDFHARFIELAAEINEQMPYHVVTRVMEALNQSGLSLRSSKILVLGVAYKKDTSDIRESPALKVIKLLWEKGAEVSYHDPHVGELSINDVTMASVDVSRETLSKADCVIITTDHSAINYQQIADDSRLVFDTKGITNALVSGNIIRL